MLHSGTSLEVFKKWAPEARNMVIIPGYCVAGTVGAKVLAGARSIDFEGDSRVPVNLQVRNLSFSAHADAKGILQLIKNCRPASVVLVHGEVSKMGQLKELVRRQFGIPCHMPANGEMIVFRGRGLMPATLSRRLVDGRLAEIEAYAKRVRAEAPAAAQEDRLVGAAKVRSGPLTFDAFLYWPEADMRAGLPPRLAPADEVPGFVDEVAGKDIAGAMDMQRVEAAVQKAAAQDCIPVVRQSATSLAVRQVQVEAGPEGIRIRWPASQAALADAILAALAGGK
jgi:hypothetical protein